MDQLITVIVSVYNGEHYLEECIQSILNQTYYNLEIILINDGSTDRSGEILDKYKALDKRILVIHKENSGVSLSRNVGLDIAHGEYICLLDQDDMFAPDYIEYYYSIIRKSGAEIAVTPKAKRFCGTVALDDNHIKACDFKIVDGGEAVKMMLYYKFVIAPWNKMISRSLIESNTLRFDKRFFSGEGFLFSIQCFQSATTVAIGKQEVYYYRLDNSNSGMTRYKESVIRSSIYAQQVIEDVITNKTSDIIKACHYAKWHTYCDCLNTFVGCDAVSENRKLYEMIKKYCKDNAVQGFNAPIPFKEKFKALLYWINPYIGACIINKLRKRKFTKSNNGI